MTITILPEIIKIAEADRKERPLQSYINHCVLQCHGDCQATKVLKEFETWLETFCQQACINDNHHPEIAVVLSKLRRIKRSKE